MFKNVRVRTLPRNIFEAVVGLADYLRRSRIANLLLARATAAAWLDGAARSPWPSEFGEHPQLLRLTRVAIRPRLALAMAAFMLAAHRDGVFIGGYTGSSSFGEQSPSVYKRHRSAFMRWLRFLRECVIPTVFIKREWTQAHGYMVEGYSFSVYFMLEGKSRSYTVGRRGELLWQPEPPADEERFFDYDQPAPEAVTCPDCKGVGFEGELDGQPVLVTKEMIEGEGFEGLEIWDCETCGGLGVVEPDGDDDDEPDCIRVHGGGYSTTGY
jgi:hypothetical protein